MAPQTLSKFLLFLTADINILYISFSFSIVIFLKNPGGTGARLSHRPAACACALK
jgi:hypothetical protein